MGVKIDFNELSNLYTISTQFTSKINGTVDRLQANINKLSNPAFTEGLQGGQGDAAVAALAQGKVALEELVETIKETGQTIDTKISQAYTLMRDKHGFSEEADAHRRNAEAAKLNRN